MSTKSSRMVPELSEEIACYYLVLRSCLARCRSDGNDSELAFLEHGGMPRPQQTEPVPVVAAREDAAEGEDDKEEERRPKGEPQRWP
jgi:hypothetical protein